MKLGLIIALITLCLSLCIGCGSGSATGVRKDAARLTQDERHQLYAAALAASDSPLDNDQFKDVCRKLEIFDASGKPNDKYTAFVSEHVNWTMKPENGQFKTEVNTKQKAHDYIIGHLPR